MTVTGTSSGSVTVPVSCTSCVAVTASGLACATTTGAAFVLSSNVTNSARWPALRPRTWLANAMTSALLVGVQFV